MKISEKTIKAIKTWLHDYELATDTTYGDEDTLDGSAYILFNKIINETKQKKKKKP